MGHSIFRDVQSCTDVSYPALSSAVLLKEDAADGTLMIARNELQINLNYCR